MFTTGTVTGHNQLLDVIVNWLTTTVGWTLIDSNINSPVGATDNLEVVLRAPGMSAGNQYFWYVNTQHDVPNGRYGWRMSSSVGYTAGVAINDQLVVSPAVYFNVWENSINYWAYANDRRLVLVCKVNTSYVSMYAGCFLPFALPTEYEKPFYLAGNYVELATYDVSNARNRMISDPGNGTAYFLNRSITQWRAVQNHASSASDVAFISQPSAFMWPHRALRKHTSVAEQGWNLNAFMNLRPNADGQMPNYLCHIVDMTDLRLIGALEGVYSTGGFGRASEQEINIGSPSKTYRLFQNVFRTTARDFMAIEEV